jgi:hypothetical protein
MSDTTLQLSLATFGIYIAGVLIGLRAARQVEPALLVVGLSLVLYPMAMGAVFLFGLQINFWMMSIAYWFPCVCFLMAFGAVYKSLSLRMMHDLLARPGRADSADELFSRYLINDSFHSRLALIEDKGLVTVVNGQYSLSPSGDRLARRVQRLQMWFDITCSG